jgi:nickel-type superoxide dismutase maturation protease
MVTAMRSVAGWSVTHCVGPSMAPTLKHGDGLLVRRARIRAGDVVVARHPAYEGLLIVKRAIRRSGDGWWLLSDNELVTSDSREFGAVADELIIGRAVLRLRDPLRVARVRKLARPG